MFATAIFISVTYLLRNVDKRLVLLTSIVIAIFAGYDPDIGDFLVLSRVFCFYPFYYLGSIINQKAVKKLTENKAVKIISSLCLVEWLLLCYVGIDKLCILKGFLTGRNAYKIIFREENINVIYGGLVRGFQYILVVCTSIGCISIIPRKKIPVILDLGKKTLQVYFWHRVVLFYLSEFGFVNYICATVAGQCAYLVLSLVMTLILSCKIFSFPTAFIIKLSKGERQVDAGKV